MPFRHLFGVGSALAVLVVLAYLPVTRAGFIWDDDDYVTGNPVLRSAAGLAAIWFRPTSTPQYYPLVFSTFWVEYQLWGLDPLGYHAVNVLLHAANGVLLWLVLRRLEVPGAWLGAALFSLHPVNVESVAWVTERKNVLSALFYLAALLAYLRFFPLGPSPAGPAQPAGRPWAWYAAALALFVAALLSKTVTCSLPAVIVLLIWWKRGRVTARDVGPLVPFFVVGLAGGLTTAWLERTHVGATGQEWALTPLERCLVAGRALWFYAGKLLWPADLTFIYPRWRIDPGVWWQYLFPAGVLVVVGSLWWARGRLGRGPLTAVLCFAGTLVPALGFFNVYPFRYSFVADHFQYLASAAFLALVAAAAVTAVRRAGVRPVVIVGVGGAWLAILAVLTWRQAGVYRNLETLWLDTLRKNPDCWMAQNNLGNIYLDRNQPEAALNLFQAALRHKPDHLETWSSVGLALMATEKLVEAESYFRQFADRFPDSTNPWSGLGHALVRQGKAEEAVPYFRRVLELKPDDPRAHLQLGLIGSARGKDAEALDHLRQAVAADPLNPDARYHLGSLLAKQGLPEAGSHFQAAVRLSPENPQFRFALGLALRRQGRTPEARGQFAEGVRAGGHWVPAAEQAVWVLSTNPDPAARDGALAAELARTVIKGVGTNPRSLALLAAACAEQGDFAQATGVARKAQELAGRAGLGSLASKLADDLRSYDRKTPLRAGPPRKPRRRRGPRPG